MAPRSPKWVAAVTAIAVSVVAALAVAAVKQMKPYAPWEVAARVEQISAKVANDSNRITALEDRQKQLLEYADITATLQLEPVGSEERLDAERRLRRLRKLTLGSP